MGVRFQIFSHARYFRGLSERTRFDDYADPDERPGMLVMVVFASTEAGTDTEIVSANCTWREAVQSQWEAQVSGRYPNRLWTIDQMVAPIEDWMSPEDAVVYADELEFRSRFYRGDWHVEMEDGVAMSAGPMPLSFILELGHRGVPTVQELWVVVRERLNEEPSVYAVEFDFYEAQIRVAELESRGYIGRAMEAPALLVNGGA